MSEDTKQLYWKIKSTEALVAVLKKNGAPIEDIYKFKLKLGMYKLAYLQSLSKEG